MFALNAAGIVKLPDNIGACKNLSNLEASVNPLGKYVYFELYIVTDQVFRSCSFVFFCNISHQIN